MNKKPEIARRQFVKFLAGSPLLAYTGMSSLFAKDLLDPDLQYLLSQRRDIISSPEKAINVFDLEAVARKTLPPAHYGYIATGVTDEKTLIANREGFDNIQLRMRRLIDVRKIDTSIELFGVKWPSPIGLAPAGSQKAFHPEGEIAVARAARSRKHLQVLSTVATSSVEQVNEARGEPVWFQLYTMSYWPATLSMIKRAEAAGCPVLVITVDYSAGANRESQEIFNEQDSRDCTACHGSPGKPAPRRKPATSGLNFKTLKLGSDTRNWELIDKIRNATDMKIVLKGIVTAEDARLCISHGIDGIIVSNHGGRSAPTGRSTIECLPEVIAAVDGKIPVMLDSGIRRGTDIFKALALGAKAVFIGRPYLWGLGAFGQVGVERVLDILHAEFSLVMQQAGTVSIDEITPEQLVIKSSG